LQVKHQIAVFLLFDIT